MIDQKYGIQSTGYLGYGDIEWTRNCLVFYN